MTRSIKLGLLALCAAAATIWLLPAASLGSGVDLRKVDNGLRDATQRLGSAVQQTVAPVNQALRATTTKAKATLDRTKRATGDAAARVTATDPLRQPPVRSEERRV